jgi:hypothetical protein
MLKSQVEDINEVPEAFRGEYKKDETSGVYKLDTDHEDPTALKSALQKERERGKVADELKKLFPGKTLAQIKAELEKRERDGDDDETDEKVKRLIEKREKAIRDELEPEAKRAKTLEEENQTLRIDGDRNKALDKMGDGPGTPFTDARELLLESTRKFFKVIDGKTVVIDEEGDPTGESVEKFFKETAKKKFPRLYKGSGNSGSDAETVTRTHGSADKTKLSPTDKIREGLNSRNRS